MKKLKITKREIVFFFLGILTVIVFDVIFNWKDCKKDFLDGWNSYKTEEKK